MNGKTILHYNIVEKIGEDVLVRRNLMNTNGRHNL